MLACDNTPYEKIGNNEPVNIADEVPFEIPDSWEWIRLKDLVEKEIKRGKSPKYADRGTVFVFAQKCNVKQGGIDISLAKYLDMKTFDKYPSEEYMRDGDIIINSTGNGTLGRIGMFHDTDRINDNIIVPDSHVTLIRATGLMQRDYLFHVLKYYQPFLEDQGEGSTNQTELRPATVAELFIPVPPLDEQIRITEKLIELLPLVEVYGIKAKSLDAYNKDFPVQLKKSILQMAVRGKLVPQDPADEPASVLLERIRAEKHRLIKEGKIKKDKHESVIFRRDNSHYEKLDGIERCIDDEIPFDIPPNWQWIRLHQLCKSIADGDHQPPPQVPTGIPFLVISNVSSGRIDFSHTRHVPQSYFESLQWNRIPAVGDLLFTVTGSYGIVLPITTSEQFCFQRHIALIKPIIVDANFLSLWLSSPLIYEQCREKATGTAQKTVGVSTLRDLLVPLPPYQEQLRIAHGLHHILQHIQSITAR